MPAKKQANGTRFSAGTQPPAASPTAGTGPGAALISDHDMAVCCGLQPVLCRSSTLHCCT